MKKVKGISLVMLTIFVLVTLISIPSCKKQEEKVIKIGAILPLTGDLALYGQNTRMGVDLAVEEINKAGGINGNKLEVLYEDNKGEAKVAVSAIRKLIQHSVSVIIDDAVSTITFSLVPIATKNRIVILSTGATNPKLSGCSPYFFRIWNSDAEEGVFAADFIKEQLKFDKVVVIYVNNDYGNGLYKVFKERFEKLGGIVDGVTFDINSKEYRALITKVKALHSQCIYLIGYAPQTGLVTKQLREQGIKLPIVGTVATEDAKFIELAGNAAEGVMYVYPKAPEGEVSEHFKKAFRKKYGKDAQILSDVGYDAAKLIAYAYIHGAKNGDDICKIFSQIKNFKGASGIIEFDENGDVHKPMIIKMIKDGKFVLYKAKLSKKEWR